MKEDKNKPLYADYRKEMVLRFFWSAPVTSRERNYELADEPLMAIGRILIIFAIGIMGYLNPFARAYPNYYVIAAICIIFIFIVTSLYKQIFVYRFGRFRVTWKNENSHPDVEASSLCDKDGNFLKTQENRKTARKSRRAFLILFAGIIAAVLLYCSWVWFSYYRVYSWRMGEIEEVKQIAQKYDDVIINDAGNGAEVDAVKDDKWDISVQDRRRLWEIFCSLHWDYVSSIQIYNNTDIYIGFRTVFGYSYLVWYEEVDSLVERFADTVIQLDEHWFYMRMDDGSRLY